MRTLFLKSFASRSCWGVRTSDQQPFAMMIDRRIGRADYSQVNPCSVAETDSTVAQREPHTLCLLSRTIYTKVNAITLKYYEEFAQFSSAIANCLDEAHLKHKKELDSLLTLRFQTFEKSQILKV